MNNVKVVEKFGEPSKKAKKRTILPVFIEYEEIGLQIDFLNSSYEDLNNPMQCICIYPPKQE